MNTASVEGAFLINSATPTGSFSWNGNTMTFTPDSNLNYNTSYDCTVLTGAKDVAGNALAEPYEWGFTTESETAVVTVSPLGGATDVALLPTISVTFIEAMNTASVEGAFLINSATPTGSYSWSGNTMTFTPSTSLNEDTIYTCTVGTGAKDVDGNTFAAAYVWSFTTGPAPTIISVFPGDGASNVDISSKIYVTFSEAMNETSVQNASSINPTITAGSYSWSGNTATATPISDLASNTKYTCTVGTNAEDLVGNHLAVQYQWSFTTAP